MVHILKVPYDSGHRCERMARGPGYLLSKGVLAGEHVEAVESDCLPEVQCAFDLARKIAARVHAISAARDLPVVLSGNCSSAVGTIAGLDPHRTGVLWFDAHAEFNTPETSLSGFFDGMPLAVATGRCWTRLARSIPHFSLLPEKNLILVGVRQTDTEEQEALDRSAVRQVSRVTNCEAVLSEVAGRVDHWYIHLDLDVLDPQEATANQWVPPKGLLADEVVHVIREARRRRPVKAVGLASLDPVCDADGRAVAVADRLLNEALAG